MSWRPMIFLAVLAGVLAAALLPAVSQATPPGTNGRIAHEWKDRAANSAPADRLLAGKLVVAQSDVPSFMTESGGGWARVVHRCLATSGFRITAWAGSPSFLTPHTGIDSAATVLKTRSMAKRYYLFATKAMRRCLPRFWRHVPPPRPTVGHMRVLTLPRYGDRSAAWRLPLAYHSALAGGGFKKYTQDWVVVRRARAVVVDLFSFYVGWPSGDTDPSVVGVTLTQEEDHVVSRQLARGFGAVDPRPPARTLTMLNRQIDCTEGSSG